jgi:hypothetical protein
MTILKLVGGTEVKPTVATEQPKRKRRGPYKLERHRIEYQDGLPVIDPAGEEDPIFQDIAKHRAAIVHYDRCIDIESAAEERDASADELFYIHNNSKLAFDEMMLRARAVILTRPTTRRGLIHQARYLASQFTDTAGCESGGPYLPDKIGEQPWQLAFLRSLAAGLRKMAGELDAPQSKGDRQ